MPRVFILKSSILQTDIHAPLSCTPHVLPSILTLGHAAGQRLSTPSPHRPRAEQAHWGRGHLGVPPPCSTTSTKAMERALAQKIFHFYHFKFNTFCKSCFSMKFLLISSSWKFCSLLKSTSANHGTLHLAFKLVGSVFFLIPLPNISSFIYESGGHAWAYCIFIVSCIY